MTSSRHADSVHRINRRTVLLGLGSAALAGMAGRMSVARAAAATTRARCDRVTWPLWEIFKTYFMEADGRVVDISTPQMHSTSEGQSYAMFFALVANDPASFELMWRWSVNNLLAGDLSANLPAWQWGRDDKGAWRVLDKNSASDADLWFVYALSEADRLWKRPQYMEQARQLLAHIEARETATLPGLGKMLLPGEFSFAESDAWRLNPSYLPVPLLRKMAQLSPKGGWQDMATHTLTLIQQSAPKGFSPDWLSYERTGPDSGRFAVDRLRGDLGSYDAIRVYMWAGMTPADDPLSPALLQATSGLARATRGAAPPPEKVATLTGEVSGAGPFGFSAALLPYLKATGQTALLDLQRLRLDTLQRLSLLPETLESRRPSYYDYVLTLFSLGWIERRYVFRRDGNVQLLWETSCL